MEDWLKKKAPELHPIATKWFDEIKKCGPDVQAIFHDGYPMGCIDKAPFAYVNIYSTHVNVGFFYGADLPDPIGLLEGTGKQGRHIKLRPGEERHDDEIEALIRASYVDIKQKLR